MVLIFTFLLLFVAQTLGGDITPSQPCNPVKNNTEITLTVNSFKKFQLDQCKSVVPNLWSILPIFYAKPVKASKNVGEIDLCLTSGVREKSQRVHTIFKKNVIKCISLLARRLREFSIYHLEGT